MNNNTAASKRKVPCNLALERPTAVETLCCKVKNLAFVKLRIVKAKEVFAPLCLRTLLAVMATVAVDIFAVTAYGAAGCFAREGKTPIIDKKHRSDYERKLFLTPDEMARYVFLTNRRDEGDRSAAVYRTLFRKGSLPGDYWITATVATDSLIDHPSAAVRRFDAPLPASVAKVLHELWLAVCRQSHTDEEALPSAPTGVFSVVAVGGARPTVVVVSLVDERSLCLSMLNLGESLIDYAKLPVFRRVDAARKIEKESQRLLAHVSQKK
jgi:hypothetical protein